MADTPNPTPPPAPVSIPAQREATAAAEVVRTYAARIRADQGATR
ncbi:hypothetical protein [Streptomyces sp. NPDC049879]